MFGVYILAWDYVYEWDLNPFKKQKHELSLKLICPLAMDKSLEQRSGSLYLMDQIWTIIYASTVVPLIHGFALYISFTHG